MKKLHLLNLLVQLFFAIGYVLYLILYLAIYCIQVRIEWSTSCAMALFHKYTCSTLIRLNVIINTLHYCKTFLFCKTCLTGKHVSTVVSRLNQAALSTAPIVASGSAIENGIFDVPWHNVVPQISGGRVPFWFGTFDVDGEPNCLFLLVELIIYWILTVWGHNQAKSEQMFQRIFEFRWENEIWLFIREHCLQIRNIYKIIPTVSSNYRWRTELS